MSIPTSQFLPPSPPLPVSLTQCFFNYTHLSLSIWGSRKGWLWPWIFPKPLESPEESQISRIFWISWGRDFCVLRSLQEGQCRVGSITGICYFLPSKCEQVPSPILFFNSLNGDSNVTGNLWHDFWARSLSREGRVICWSAHACSESTPNPSCLKGTVLPPEPVYPPVVHLGKWKHQNPWCHPLHRLLFLII